MDKTGNIELNYCFNCMTRLTPGETRCPDCGYDNSVNHNPPDALPEGSMLAGHYLVGKILGQGGFGITYLGFDTSLKKRVAIKEYFPRLVCTRVQGTNRVTGIASLSHPEDFQNGLEEFRKEAETLAQISSPNIVRVLNTFRENGTSYIVMEYADGISLSKEVMNRGGRLPWQRVTDLFRDLIRELGKLHEKHLIHRDIKPDNLQIVKDENREERLVLLDFGTARHFASAEVSQTYTAMLTPGYAPLEQYSPKSKQGPYTDVYALCATMYALITGEVPSSATERSLEETQLRGIKEQGINVPERIEKALLHGLEVKREARPQTMGELYAELYGADPKPVSDDPNDLIYQAGMKRMAADTPEEYKQALTLFEQIPGWKDADHMAEICREKIRGEAPTVVRRNDPGPRDREGDPKKWILILLIAALIGGGVIFVLNLQKKQVSIQQTLTAIFMQEAELTAQAAEAETPEPVIITQPPTAAPIPTNTPVNSVTDTAVENLPAVLPVIDYFYVSPESGMMGDQASAYWSVSDADRVTITVDGDMVYDGSTASGFADISSAIQPAETHSIILTAHSGNEETSSTVYYKMAEPPAEEPAVSVGSDTGTPELIIKDNYVDERSGAEMIYIPAGSFLLGSNLNEDPHAEESEEAPQIRVYLDGYWIGKTEVTNAQYQRCVEAKACDSGYYMSIYQPDLQNYPVTYVTAEQAESFCSWMGGSLPSEYQWEKAARGTDGRIYPWGNEEPGPDNKLANIPNYVNEEGFGNDLFPVGSFPDGQSPYGLMDMAGNVWEWTSTWYSMNYYQTLKTEEELSGSIISNPTGPENGSSRVIRGGSCAPTEINYYIAYTRAAVRSYMNLNSSYYIGFRCIVPDTGENGSSLNP